MAGSVCHVMFPPLTELGARSSRELWVEPCISALFYAPRARLRANFYIIVQTQAGPGLGLVLGFSLFLYFRHLSISDEKNCRAGGNNTRQCYRLSRAARRCLVSSSSERAVSAAEEVCVQMHTIG